MINWQAVRAKRTHHLALDLSMLGIAILHLLLLLFDTTYFSLRPFYSHYFPQAVHNYDPIKGVEPHRFTVGYLAESQRYFAACAEAKKPPNAHGMVALSNTMIEENPFAQANLTGKLQLIKIRMMEYTNSETSSKQAFKQFWSDDCSHIAARQRFFEEEIAPNIRMNYWREIGVNGKPADYFIWIDLFFIAIFLLEFLISWNLAIRRQGSDQKFLYPLYHWYDIVSCIPIQQLRILRLLRILAIYFRLIRSDIISIHNSTLYKRMMKYQQIIMEEISDQVAINILTNIQAKTRLGSNRDLMEETLNMHRHEIRDVILSNLKNMDLPTLHNRQDELVAIIAELVMESIRGTREYKNVIALPLARPVIESILNEARIANITEEAMDSFMQAWQAKLESEEMNSILSDLVDDILDLSIKLSLNDRIQQLIEDINIQVLEELKESSTKDKIWKAQQQELLLEKLAHRQAELDNWS